MPHSGIRYRTLRAPPTGDAGSVTGRGSQPRLDGELHADADAGCSGGAAPAAKASERALIGKGLKPACFVGNSAIRVAAPSGGRTRFSQAPAAAAPGDVGPVLAHASPLSTADTCIRCGRRDRFDAERNAREAAVADLDRHDPGDHRGRLLLHYLAPLGEGRSLSCARASRSSARTSSRSKTGRNSRRSTA